MPVTFAAVLVPRFANVTVATTVWPAVAVLGRLIVVTTSASGTTVTVPVPVGVVGVFAGVVVVALATFVTTAFTLVALLKFTTTVSVALVLAARLAITRLTVWPFTLTVPVLATGVPTRFAPTGSASVTVTFAAVLGPAFATTITKLVVAVPAYTVVLPTTLLIVSDA